MDPTSVCCPHLDCPARGHTGQGTMGLHARKATCGLCTQGHNTLTATSGVVFSRWRPAAATVALVVTWLAPGCPRQALVAALRFDQRPVAAWWARAGPPGQAVHA